MPTSQEIAATAGTPLWDANAYIAALVYEENQRKAQSQPAQISPQEDARLEEIKRQEAFSQPRNDNNVPRSAEFMAINQQYAASRNQVVTSGGSVYQGPTSSNNPYAADTAAGIAWDVAKTGGATDTRLNAVATQQVVAQGGNPSFIRYASDIYVERPSYQQETLTTKTGQTFVNEAWTGVPIRLNLTRDEMAGFAPVASKNYFKYNQDTFMLDKVTPSPANIGIDPGIHTRFGDFGGPILKGATYGGWSRNDMGISSTSLVVDPSYVPFASAGTGRLVGGNKVADAGTRIDATSPQNVEMLVAGGALPKPFRSGNEGTTVITKPTGDVFGYQIPVISSAIAFFQPGKSVTTRESSQMLPEVTTLKDTKVEQFDGGVLTTNYYETTGGKTVTKTITEKSTPSAFDTMSGSFAASTTIKALPDISKTSPEVLRSAVSAASIFNPAIMAVTANPFVGKQSSEFIGGVAVGEYTGLREKPLETGASYLIGAGFGAGFKALEVVGARSTVWAVGAYPGTTATLTKLNTSILPTVIGGLYAADIVGRSTEYGKSLEPAKVGSSFGSILSTEAIPMIAGGYAGYKVADVVAARFPSLSTVPGEAAIISGAKPSELEVTKATIDVFKTVKGIDSPMQQAPKLEQVSGVKSVAGGIESQLKVGDTVIFGRTVETGQMPAEYIAGRGMTKDVDVFRSDPSATGKNIAKAYPDLFTPKQGEKGLDYTALISSETKQTALDIHQFPVGHAGGGVQGDVAGKDIVKGLLNPIPTTKSGILYTEGLPQEKLYVQTQRKATSALGEEPGAYGPPEHRYKDIYDLLRYTSFFGEVTKSRGDVIRSAKLKSDFETIQAYALKPEVISKYTEPTEYAARIKEMKFGKPEPGLEPIKMPSSREDVIFSEVPGRISKPSVYAMGSPSAVISPIFSKTSVLSSSSGASDSKSGRSVVSDISSLISTSGGSIRSKVSELLSPSVASSQQSRSPVSMSSSPSVGSQTGSSITPSISSLPKISSYPLAVQTPSFSERTTSNMVNYPTVTPRTSVTSRINTDTSIVPIVTPTVTTAALPFMNGGPGPSPFGRKRRYNFMEVFNMGLDIGGPIMTAPRGMRPPKVKRSSLPGGKQKVKVSRKRK